MRSSPGLCHVMPQSSKMLTSAALIIVDQAKLKNDGATISRIINMVVDMPPAFELPALLPTFYKCAGLAYAANRDVRAESMFEGAQSGWQKNNPPSARRSSMSA